MVDKHVGKQSFETGNTYWYKNKVEIPPLAMQDDTLGISECGLKTRAMNAFLNFRTKMMNLQFGSDICVRMHIKKNPQHKYLCGSICRCMEGRIGDKK